MHKLTILEVIENLQEIEKELCNSKYETETSLTLEEAIAYLEELHETDDLDKGTIMEKDFEKMKDESSAGIIDKNMLDDLFKQKRGYQLMTPSDTQPPKIYNQKGTDYEMS